LEETGKILRKTSDTGDYWSLVRRNRENTQENIRHWGLLISGWKVQGKHQTLGIIDQWLEETGKILRKVEKPGDYWSVVGTYRENAQESIRPWQLLISGWNIQGKYSGKHQTREVIDQWLEETGNYSGKHQNLGEEKLKKFDYTFKNNHIQRFLIFYFIF
jgi:hypothetical protein